MYTFFEVELELALGQFQQRKIMRKNHLGNLNKANLCISYDVECWEDEGRIKYFARGKCFNQIESLFYSLVTTLPYTIFSLEILPIYSCIRNISA